jgi:hypothetical protein
MLLTFIRLLLSFKKLPLLKIKTDKMRYNSILFFLAISFVTVISCNINPLNDLTTEGGKSEWAIPLIDSKKSFRDIINGFDKQAFLQIAPDGSLVLQYKGDFIARSSLDIFSSFQNAIFPVLDTAMSVPFSLPKGVHVDYVDIKQGALDWFMRSPNDPLNVTLRIPQMTKNGVPFEEKFAVTSFGYKGTLDMKGWRIEALNDSIYVYHDARKSNGERVNLKGNGVFNIKDFQFQFVKGFLGVDTFDVPRDTIKMDFFENWRQGEVRFEDPKMKITLDNSFGLPVRSFARVADVISINGQHLSLKSALTKGIDINYPKLNEIGQSKRTSVILDKNNSNLADIINLNPVAIDYDIDGITNPDPALKQTGFMTDTSAFKLQMEIDLPIYGTAKNFVINDTFSIDLSQYTNVNFAELKIITDNGMPIDLSMQGFFANANGTVIDSFYNASTAILRGAPVGNDGLPRSIQSAENVIKLDVEKLKKILPSKKLIIRYSFSTTNNGSVPVRLTASQDVRVRIGLKFGATY